MDKVKSCIKWTGGKFREIDKITNYIPQNFNIYVEPFVGGGALFWTLQKHYASDVAYHINDINKDLINFYDILQNNYTKLSESLVKHSHSKLYFNQIRDKYNHESLDNVSKASIFYYLNKTAFSGKYRVNSSGEYNNSWGSYKNITWDTIPIYYHRAIQDVKITSDCAENIMELYSENEDAFIFLDPPYFNSDDMYNNPTENDLFGLYREILNQLKKSKAKILLIAGDSEFIREEFKDFICKEYEFRYLHNAKAVKSNNHIIIKNYK